MNPVGWFEIPVTDMDRAQAFYEKVFETSLERHPMGPLEMAWFPMDEDGKGATGSLVKGEAYVPTEDGVKVYFTAPDFPGALARVEEAGGTVVQGEKEIGEYGFVAVVQDTEGNVICLHRRKDV